MVPIGEAKGTALALMVEILSTVMVGAARSTEASSFFSADGQPPAVGQFIIGMKPMDQTGFESRLREMLHDIASMEGARIPGTRRVADRQQAERDGLNVPTHYIRAIRQLISAVR